VQLLTLLLLLVLLLAVAPLQKLLLPHMEMLQGWWLAAA
jgi:hypothetical protein